MFLFQCRSAVGTVFPIGLCALSAVGTRSDGNGGRGVPRVARERDNAVHDEGDHADGDEPHEEHSKAHAEPTEGRVSPITHHSAVAAIASHHAIASTHPCTDPEESDEDDDDDEGDC